jgi:hypothetical protein
MKKKRRRRNGTKRPQLETEQIVAPRWHWHELLPKIINAITAIANLITTLIK